MVANNYIEIYTLIFGWNMYGAIWDILVGSGLALIPFIVAIVMNFKDNYESGDAKSAIKGMEMTLLGMMLVMMLCVMPFRGMTLSLASVEYNFNVPDCNAPVATSNGTGTSTGTQYDSGLGASVAGMNVFKPVAWHLVELLSSAITHTSIKSMGCVNNYEMMLLRVSQIEIIDPVLRERIRAFTEHCFQKAKERYDANPIVIPGNVHQVEDIDWIGSRIFLTNLNEYYRHEEAYMANMQDFGYNRMPATRASDLAIEHGANPYCYEVWSGEQAPGTATGLRQAILDSIPTDKVGPILTDWMNWGSEVLTVGTADNATKQDLILKMILQSQSEHLSSANEVNLSNDFEVEKSFWKGLFDDAMAAGGVFATVDEFLQANVMKQMVKVAGPMILALIQMVVIMGGVFVMVMGGYKLQAFTAVALTYFSLEFINAIWAAAFWFDQQILDLYISQAGWFDIATNTFLVSAVSAGAIILLPTVWLSIMAYAGAGMVRGMGMMGVGGGTASGSSVGGGAHRGAAKVGGKVVGKAYQGVKSRLGK